MIINILLEVNIPVRCIFLITVLELRVIVVLFVFFVFHLVNCISVFLKGFKLGVACGVVDEGHVLGGGLSGGDAWEEGF